MYTAQFQRFSTQVTGVEVDLGAALQAVAQTPQIVVSPAESLPFLSGSFDVVFSHEVIEHVADDRAAVAEMARVARPGGRIAIFAPNRWYPVEQHGVYWRGEYHFGNTPLVNYLPNPLRNRLAPHVRTYTGHGLRALLDGLPLRLLHHGRIFGGYDNIVRRSPRLGGAIRRALYAAEGTPLSVLGLSHFLVLEKV